MVDVDKTPAPVTARTLLAGSSPFVEGDVCCPQLNRAVVDSSDALSTSQPVINVIDTGTRPLTQVSNKLTDHFRQGKTYRSFVLIGLYFVTQMTTVGLFDSRYES